jgi:Flp pilus assembly pilin Flp
VPKPLFMSRIFINVQLAFYRAFDEEQGQGLTEYALILALIAVVAIVSLRLIGDGVKSELTSAATSL